MAKRNIGKEISLDLEEIKAWRRGEVKLRTFAVELPRAADVLHIRRDSARWAKVIKRSGAKID